MRSRAALLPHPADPFLLNYWLHFFNEKWQDEIDRLYIYINSPIEKEVIDYMMHICRCNKKIEILYSNLQMEHGAVLDSLLNSCREEYVMLIEDDGFIFKKGVVDAYFSLLESGQYDIVGSARGSCSMEIWQAAKDKYNLDYSGMGDVGPNFWPCYFFSKRQTLLDTDRNFGAKHWPKGTKIEELGFAVQNEGCYGDTFVNTSIQLRAKFPTHRIHMIPQYHGSPDDIKHYDQKYNLFDGRAFWTHVGSLSSGTHGVLQDEFGRSLARRKLDPPGKVRLPGRPTTEQEKEEWERRLTFWKMFHEHYLNGNYFDDNIEEFAIAYGVAIKRIIEQFGLSESHIKIRQQIYRTIGL